MPSGTTIPTRPLTEGPQALLARPGPLPLRSDSKRHTPDENDPHTV